MTLNDFRKDGYDQEEFYFKELEQEQLQRLREKRSAERKEQAAGASSEDFWMRCPKCGSAMKELEVSSILIDHCESCGGLYFDAGELDLLLQARNPTGVFAALVAALKK